MFFSAIKNKWRKLTKKFAIKESERNRYEAKAPSEPRKEWIEEVQQPQTSKESTIEYGRDISAI